MTEIFLFTGEACAPCASAKAILKTCARFEAIDVEDPANARAVRQFAIQAVPTLVALVFSGTEARTEQYVGSITRQGVELWLKKIGVRK